MTARLRMPQAGDPASFPRVIAPANNAIALPAAALPPVGAFDPPIQPSAPVPAALPAQGVTDGVEARTIDQTWPENATILTGAEVFVYTTQKQWPACDVYIEGTGLQPSELVTVRIYAVSAQGAQTLVASGRVGHYSLAAGQTVYTPLWVAAARCQAQRFAISIQVLGSVDAFAGQHTKVTIVASERSDDAPPMLGAARFNRRVLAGAQLATDPDPELLMVQAVVDAAVAAPRYLHVHDRAGAVNGQIPAFAFPLGAGVAAAGGGGFGGAWWFPPGMRAPGARIWTLAPSSTAGVTTIVADVFIQGLYR